MWPWGWPAGPRRPRNCTWTRRQNVYGSGAYDGWWSSTKQDVAAGSFTNVRSGTYPGSTTIDPIDEISYSTGDLGRRLHWVYWLPGETVDGLAGRFETKWAIDWAGDDLTYDGGWAPNTATAGWSEPGSTTLEDYDADGDSEIDGVIGTFGFAWWATDNEAAPFSTGGNAYDEADAADIEALRQDVLANQTYARGYIRIRSEPAATSWEVTSLQANIVPVPAAAWMGLSLLGAVGGGAGLRRWKRPAA